MFFSRGARDSSANKNNRVLKKKKLTTIFGTEFSHPNSQVAYIYNKLFSTWFHHINRHSHVARIDNYSKCWWFVGGGESPQCMLNGIRLTHADDFNRAFEFGKYKKLETPRCFCVIFSHPFLVQHHPSSSPSPSWGIFSMWRSQITASLHKTSPSSRCREASASLCLMRHGLFLKESRKGPSPSEVGKDDPMVCKCCETMFRKINGSMLRNLKNVLSFSYEMFTWT